MKLKNIPTWLKGGIFGISYYILTFLLVIMSTDVLSFKQLFFYPKVSIIFFYHFISDLFVSGSPFYSGSIIYILYGIFISPLTLFYKLVIHFNYMDIYPILIIGPLLFFFLVGGLIGLTIKK